MGSETKGSANVAGAMGADAAGQTVDFTDDTTIKLDGDVSDLAQGLTMVAPDGTVYKVAVTNAGGITTAALS